MSLKKWMGTGLLATMFAAPCLTRAGSVTSEFWGTIDGKPVHRYILKNDSGLVIKVTNHGAIITELHLPDRQGHLADVVLGFDSLDGYIAGHPYFGAIVGRCANRIAKGRFELADKQYQLACNNGPNHLHGGVKGFDKCVWDATPLTTPDGPALKLTRVALNGEEGYPGNLTITVIYTLSNDNALKTDITATTDTPTLCNLAQHTYWNLAGHASGAVFEHLLQINADRHTPVDDTLIPTGELAPVEGTPFDFRDPKPIGKELHAVGGDPIGYDHNWVINGTADAMKHVGTLSDPGSGRVMELHSNQPGCQFYSGNFLDGTNIGKGGAVYRQYGGICLETQKYPDAVNHPEWPGVELRPGETYHHVMIIKFSTRD